MSGVYFKYEACPLSTTCSLPSWTRAQVWGWTLEECQERLDAHLQGSSLHNGLADDERKTLIDDACIVEKTYNEKQWQGSKRQKTTEGSSETPDDHGGSGSYGGSGSSWDVHGLAIVKANVGTDKVTLPVIVLDQAKDALERADNACQSAITMLEQGATAFREELTIETTYAFCFQCYVYWNMELHVRFRSETP